MRRKERKKGGRLNMRGGGGRLVFVEVATVTLTTMRMKMMT
jgi:hypothetical protein